MVPITDTGNMHIDENSSKVNYVKHPLFLFSAILASGYLYSSSAVAINWSITPRLQFQEVYSDNLNPFSTSSTTFGTPITQSKNKKSGFATIVSPGVSVIGQSARNMLNLNYNVQGIYNRDGTEGVDFFNQLQFNSQHKIISDRLFLQTSSSISQQNTNNLQIRPDNIGNSNRTTISTVTVSPYWTPHFGTFADGLFRANLSTVTAGNNTTSVYNTNGTLQAGNFSDSVSVSELVQLNSGNDFKTVTWNGAYSHNKTYRSGGDDVSFQNYYGTLRGHISKTLNIFATAGETDNQIGGFTNNINAISNNKNGFYYTVGMQWKPNENFYIEAGGGNNSYATVSLSPMRRVNWVTTFRHNSVGLNNGNTWQTNLNYQARNSTWYLSHVNNTLTSQEAILLSLNNTNNPGGQTTGSQQIPIYNYYNDVFVIKTWNLGVNYTTGKSNLGANLFDQDTTSTTKTVFNKQTSRGVSGFWNWQFAPKTSAYLRPTWQQIHGANSLSKRDYYDISVGMTRSITNSLTGGLEFRHIDQSSGIDFNSYQENRATASLYMRF